MPRDSLVRSAFIGIAVVIVAALPGSSRAASGDFVADAVLGQTNFTSKAAGIGATGLTGPTSVAVDPTSGRLYVADRQNHRVLSWPSGFAFTNGEAADMVIGQTDFTGTTANHGLATPAANTFNRPLGLAVDKLGNLYVADNGNFRVLEFDNPAVFDTIADRVFGQPGFTTASGATTAAGLGQVTAVALDASGRLFVVDIGNSRVLAYDAPLSSDTIADKVWGQPDFMSSGANNGGISAATLNSPLGICFDAFDNLYIADSSNNRVLEYNGGFAGSTTASRVYGWPDFVTQNLGGTSAMNISSPSGLAVDFNGSLYITDTGNSRVLIFDTPLTAPNGGPADRVLGQPAFFPAFPGTSATAFDHPFSLTFDARGNAYVADTENNRVLRFDGLAIDSSPATQFTSTDVLAIPLKGEATPYPSILNVSGITGTVTKVTVVLKHLSHSFPEDLDIFLIGPGGQGVKLMSDCGDTFDLRNVDLIFNDNAAANLPDATQIVAGSYKPTDFGLDAPALNGLGVLLSVFNGVNPNGDWKLYVIDDGGGDQGSIIGWGLNIFTQPVLQSSPTATPNPAGIEQDVAFSVAAVDGSNRPLQYLWNFADETGGLGSSVTHSFVAAGTFHVTVTVSDGGPATVSGSVDVVVLDPLVGTGHDIDGDGFSDAFETQAGSDPALASSTPLGGISAAAGRLDFPDVKMGIKLNFGKTGNDAISLAGTLVLPAGFDPNGKTLSVNIGGVMKSFVLQKGAAKDAAGSVKLSSKGTSARTGKLALKLSKGTFAATLAGAGLTNATITKDVSVPVTVILGSGLYTKIQVQSYKATAGKSGATKDKP